MSTSEASSHKVDKACRDGTKGHVRTSSLSPSMKFGSEALAMLIDRKGLYSNDLMALSEDRVSIPSLPFNTSIGQMPSSSVAFKEVSSLVPSTRWGRSRRTSRVLSTLQVLGIHYG